MQLKSFFFGITAMLAIVFGLQPALLASRDCLPNDFKLTDALSRPSESQTTTSISDDGSQVYLVYNVTETPGEILAELFNNVHGKLVSSKTVLLDPNFPIIGGGWASPDFTKFSILDAVITGANSLDARIRILDQNFNVLVSRVQSLTFQNLAAVLAAGGKFSEDGKYINANITDGAIPNSSTNFFVYRTSDLATVAFKNIPLINTQPSEFITLENRGKKQYFVTFQSATGYYSSNFESTLQPPYFIQVYNVDFNDATLNLVDQSQLPKFAEVDVDVLRMADKALIAHGGFCSLFPNQLSIYDTNNLKTTSLPHDNAEARVLEFNGKKLKVIFKQATNCCSRLVFYPPNEGRTYMFGQNIVTNINGDPQNQTTLQEFYVLANIGCSNGRKRLVPINSPRQDVTDALPKFSKNGKWFIRTGSYGYFNGNPTVDAVGVHNVLFFKVI